MARIDNRKNDQIRDIKITRNSGIFIESPMFAVNLVIALLVEIFVRKNHKKYRTIILVITIITTTDRTHKLWHLYPKHFTSIGLRKTASISGPPTLWMGTCDIGPRTGSHRRM